MHELSVVMSIVEIAEQTAREQQSERVEAIELDIGTLSGIELNALEFVWASGVKGTVLEGASRRIHVVPGEGKCLECGSLFEMDYIYDICPHCHSYSKEITAGKELRIRSFIINKN